MPLTSSQRRELRARAHTLNPVVQTGGKGLTDAVTQEVEAALAAHELIKVRFPGMEREDRKAAAAQLSKQTRSEIVGEIGAIAILYRAKPVKPEAASRPKTAAKPGRKPVGRGESRGGPAKVPGRRGPGAASRRGGDRSPWKS